MTTRWEVERAIRGSDLSPQGRLIVLTLLTLADAKTCVVPAEFTPSLTTLVKQTGLSSASVKRALNVLEADGWVIRRRPTVAAARSTKERTQYQCAVPVGLCQSPTSHESRLAESLELGSDRAGLGSQRALSWAQGEPQAIPLPDQKQQRAATGLTQSLEAKPTTAEEIVIEATGATAEEAQLVIKLIQKTSRPRSMPGFVRRLAEDGDLVSRLEEIRSARREVETPGAVAALRTGPLCPHEEPGGASLHPTTGKPLCPLCRLSSQTPPRLQVVR